MPTVVSFRFNGTGWSIHTEISDHVFNVNAEAIVCSHPSVLVTPENVCLMVGKSYDLRSIYRDGRLDVCVNGQGEALW